MIFYFAFHMRGGRIPFRVKMVLVLINRVLVCEGLEQRVVPTRVAAGVNEIDGAPIKNIEKGYLCKSKMDMDTAQ